MEGAGGRGRQGGAGGAEAGAGGGRQLAGIEAATGEADSAPADGGALRRTWGPVAKGAREIL
jgi:hypothetical protein